MDKQKEAAERLSKLGYGVVMFDYDFDVGAVVEAPKRKAFRGPSPFNKAAYRYFWSRPVEAIVGDYKSALS